MTKFVAAVLALYSCILIETSLPHLPSRIPVHFNLAGQPDGWGSPHTLWVLLGSQVLIAGLLLSMSIWGRRFPQAVHLGTRRLSDFTPAQRQRVWPLLDQMAGWMSVAAGLFFVDIIRESIRAAESSRPRFHQAGAPLVFVVVMVGLALYYMWRINKAANAAGD